jgi:undecaprenyl-diphosphatase
MFFNSLATRSWYFDNFVRFICDNQIIKSGLIVSLLWWFWFRPGDDRQKRASWEKVVSTIVASLVAFFLARSPAVILPSRQRPIADAALNFKLPLGPTTSPLSSPLLHWSAFPSDNTVLFFCLARVYGISLDGWNGYSLGMSLC